jgi:hypothetical protein
LSHSGVLRFQECPRRWIIHADSDSVQKHLGKENAIALRAQVRLTFWDALAGRAVDDVLTFAIRKHVEKRRKGTPPDKAWTRKPLDEAGVETLEGYRTFSERFRMAVQDKVTWPKKRQPVDRLYYQEPVSDEEWARCRETVRKCLQAFDDSDLREIIADTEVDRIHVQRIHSETGMPWFLWDGLPYYAAYDLMLDRDDEWLILDWKCGRLTQETEEKALLQLQAYAAYVHFELGQPLDRIRLMPVWLSVPGDWMRFGVDEVRLEQIHRTIREVYIATGSGLEALAAGRHWDEVFPIAENPGVCRNCTLHSCEGWKRWQALKGTQSGHPDVAKPG